MMALMMMMPCSEDNQSCAKEIFQIQEFLLSLSSRSIDKQRSYPDKPLLSSGPREKNRKIYNLSPSPQSLRLPRRAQSKAGDMQKLPHCCSSFVRKATQKGLKVAAHRDSERGPDRIFQSILSTHTTLFGDVVAADVIQ